MAEGNQTVSTMDSDKKFELHYEALKDEYQTYVNDVIKSMGFLIVVLGWLITSKDARNYIATAGIQVELQVILVLLAIGNISIYAAHYYRSKRLNGLIVSLGEEYAGLPGNYVLNLWHILINLIPIIGLFIAIYLTIGAASMPAS